MESAIFLSNSKSDLKLLINIAQKMGVNTKKLSQLEIEDLGLAKAIKLGATGEYIDNEQFIKDIENEVLNR